ncbi:dCTP deaminase/dUTPase family protein [Hellea balneolensis]|uniref:hypothetical protein n=1 Tax=Hellea balneolensis TaxID=287478 RepID=UPI0004184D70|nr:hypothetical protein [Hellea balneolensis]
MSAKPAKPNRRLSAAKLQTFELEDVKQAETLATPFKFKSGKVDYKDPWPKIDASLLSADDIIEYVRKTGMVFPFSAKQEDEKPRLKAASYEGRIGENAFVFNSNEYKLESILSPDDDNLTIPANSIVFVECDLEFRLPPFIAVRFNLQINHVHRGLLLGTGPLVDPCFWGKLCIPLHNLTNEPYTIPLTEGLIWVEFTKMTGMPKAGRPPSNTEFWEIEKFISKAASQFNPNNPRVAIRSSIPEATVKATQQATIARTKATEAQSAADTAKGAAEKAKNIGLIAGLGIFLAVLALWATFYIEMHTQHKQLRPRLEKVIAENGKLKDRVKVLESKELTILKASEPTESETDVPEPGSPPNK